MSTKLSKPIEKALILLYNGNRWCLKMLNNEIKTELNIDEVYSKQTKEVRELLDLAKRNLEQRDYVKNNKLKIKKIRSVSTPMQVNLHDLSEIEELLNQKLQEMQSQMSLYSENLEYIFQVVQEKEEKGNCLIGEVSEKYVLQCDKIEDLKSQFTRQEEEIQQVKDRITMTVYEIQQAILEEKKLEEKLQKEEQEDRRQALGKQLEVLRQKEEVIMQVIQEQIQLPIQRLEAKQEQQNKLIPEMLETLLKQQNSSQADFHVAIQDKLQAFYDTYKQLDGVLVASKKENQEVLEKVEENIQNHLIEVKGKQQETLEQILKQQEQAYQKLQEEQLSLKQQISQMQTSHDFQEQIASIKEQSQATIQQMQKQLEEKLFQMQSSLEKQMENLAIEDTLKEDILKGQQVVQDTIIETQKQLYTQEIQQIVSSQDVIKQSVIEAKEENQKTIQEIEIKQEELFNGQIFYFTKVASCQEETNQQISKMQQSIEDFYQERSEKEKMAYVRQIREQEDEIRRLHLEIERSQEKIEKMIQNRQRQSIFAKLIGKEVVEEEPMYVSQILAYNL